MTPIDLAPAASSQLRPSDIRWWSPGRIVRRAVSIWRRDGVGGIWDRTLAEFGYRRIELLRIEVDPLSSDVVGDIQLDVLEHAQVEEYLLFHPGHSRVDVAVRLQGGDVCHCARREGRIVSVAWTTMRPHVVRYVGQIIPIEADEVYLYDAFTPPEWRSNNLMTTLIRSLAKQYQCSGKRHVIMAVRRHNRSMSRVAAKLGARPYAVMTSARRTA